MSILIKDIDILTMEAGENGCLRSPHKGAIVIEGEDILSVGGYDSSGNYDTVVDGKNMLAMPGLINTHSHSAMSLFRGYADDMDLMSWLFDKIFPLEARLVAGDVRTGSELAMLEMIKSGTTTFNDMYFFMEETARAAEDSGMRAYLAPGITDPSAPGFDPLPPFIELFEKWQGKADGRISFMPGPHAPYTCSPELLQRVIELAKQYRLPLHIHLAETQAETQQIKEKYGKRPAEYLADLGFFDGIKVLAAHGVYLDEGDIGLLAGKEVTVMHNPRSNMKLASGLAPVRELMKAGINVSLGTDSACSNNNLDMFQEMRAAAYAAKVRELDPLAVPAATALLMATVNGAKALGNDKIGRIAPGMKADIILLDLDKPHLTPLNDPVSHLVYSASGSDVDTVIVNGKILMKHRQMLVMDEEKIMAEARSTMENLLKV